MENKLLPIFPLGIVLMPNLSVPLHIFEERYKIMINKCLTEHQEFGIVYANGNRIYKAGSTARILKVIKTYDDGRMDILTHGEKRFLIDDIYENEPYLTAQIRYFEDHEQKETKEMLELAKEGIELISTLSQLSDKKEDINFLHKIDFRILSFLITGNDTISQQQKQHFLEMTSTAERLREGVNSLKNIVYQIKVIEDVMSKENPDRNAGKFSVN